MKLKYIIEQADNGIVIVDRTDCTKDEQAMFVEVALEKDICYQLGRKLYGEIRNYMNKELANAVKIDINIIQIKTRL